LSVRRNLAVVVVVGVFLAVLGLSLAIAPIGSARMANALRWVPYSKSSDAVRLYRGSGVVAIVLGLIVLALAI
jgi:hypothetical protein